MLCIALKPPESLLQRELRLVMRLLKPRASFYKSLL